MDKNEMIKSIEKSNAYDKKTNTIKLTVAFLEGVLGNLARELIFHLERTPVDTESHPLIARKTMIDAAKSYFQNKHIPY